MYMDLHLCCVFMQMHFGQQNTVITKCVQYAVTAHNLRHAQDVKREYGASFVHSNEDLIF